MQPQRSPKINVREIFWVVRFSTFATISGVKQTCAGHSGISPFDPGCVKTCTSRECAELFSLFSSFDGGRQSGSFVIQRNRDKLSTRKFDVGVFTQAGPGTDIGPDQ